MRKILAVGLLASLMGAGCAGATSTTVVPPKPVTPPTPSAPAPSGTVTKPVAKTWTVQINDNAFSPQVVAINAGDTVLWTNTGKNSHTVTGLKATFLWDSGNLKPGATFKYTFDTDGKYEYHDNIYASLTGTVVVGKNQP